MSKKFSLRDYLTDESWLRVLKDELDSPYFLKLEKELESAYDSQVVFPPVSDIFNAINLTPFEKIKVVILGQDPYHQKGQAHGLSFSVNEGVKCPPSLVNIFKEYQSDLDLTIPSQGSLTKWASEGVLLLNNQLSVVEGTPMSHKDLGWEQFTSAIVKILNEKKEHLVFILWGAPAQKKGKEIDHKKHLVLESVHPSPLSSYRGFFGSKPFSKTNHYLKDHNLAPIDWNISN